MGDVAAIRSVKMSAMSPSGHGDGDGARSIGVRAFVFTDIEDSTAAWEREPEVMGTAVARIVSLTDEVARAHDGTRAVEQGAGDSSVLVFASPSDALAAAVDLQRRVHDEPWPTTEPVRIRAAVHAGEVRQNPDGTFVGPTMNRCGRLLGSAHGGQVVVSMSTTELAGELGADIEVTDLGLHRLRGIDQPVRIGQLHADGLPSEFPPLRTLDASAALIPRYRTDFVGQEAALDELMALLSAGGIVTVVGTGGCGKTRLAAEAASRAIESFPDGVVWVDLGLLDDGALVSDATAAALGVRCGTRPPVAAVVDHLRSRQAVVVLDNCEHLVDDAAELAVAVRDACPQVSVLATSREPLSVSEEIVRRVPPLTVPDVDTVASVAASSAGALLLDRVRRSRPDFVLDDAGAGAVAQLCRRLDGIPLALELAAARMRVASAQAVVEGLDARFRLLTGGGRNALARQRTLEASVAWSYQLLSEVEATLFRRLCVFASPFDVTAALAVAGDGYHEVEVLQAIGSLVDRSLLHEADEGRLRMLETLRYFARERLMESGDADGVRDRHLDWFVRECAHVEARLEGPAVREALDALDRHIDDLRSAMRWALGTGRADDAVAIAAPAAWYWILRARVPEGLAWLVEALAPALDASPAAQLQAWWARLQLLAHHDAKHEELEASWARASEIATALEDRSTEGRLSVWWGSHMTFYAPDAGIDILTDGRDRCDEVGDQFWAAYAEGALALGRVFQGRDDLASEHLQAMAARRRVHPSTRLQVDELTRQVVVDYALGRYHAVHETTEVIARGLDGVSEINVLGTALAVDGWVRVEQGDAARVVVDMEALLVRYLNEGEMQHVPSIILALARALLAEGRPDEAAAQLQASWDVPELQRFVRARLWYRHDLALAELLTGRTASAVAGFEAMLDDATAVGNPQEQARAHFWLGQLDRRRAEHHHAEGHLHEALEIHAEHGYRQLAAGALEAVAGVELDHGRPAAGVRLLAAAAAVRAEAGVTYRLGWQAEYDADLAQAKASLDDGTFAEAWQRGTELDLADAVELARRGRGERGRPTFGWDSLTATEQKVAALLVDGRTNPEIAHTLLMGRETVKTHVSSILRKLGLANRTQVASALATRAESTRTNGV